MIVIKMSDEIKPIDSFFKTSRAFKSDASFSNLSEYYSTLQKTLISIDKHYEKFSKSKVDGKWSIVHLIKLFTLLEDVEYILKMWKIDDLMIVCSKDPKNGKCWSLQGKIAEISTNISKKINKYEFEVGYFIVEGVYNMNVLYIDEMWKTLKDPTSGKDYIYNTLNDDERLWLDIIDEDTDIQV